MLGDAHEDAPDCPPPSYEESTRQERRARRESDSHAHEWRCRFGVWFRTPVPRKPSTAGTEAYSDADESAGPWRRKFGFRYLADTRREPRDRRE